MKTKYNEAAAMREGWAVFQCDPDGELRIQRLDCPSDAFKYLPHEPMFASDKAAIKHVRSKAAQGSAMHEAALALHGTRSR